MTPERFFQRLLEENRRKKIHVIGKPATDAMLNAWLKKNSRTPMPKPLGELLKLANGCTLLKYREALQIAGGMLRIRRLNEMGPVAHSLTEHNPDPPSPKRYIPIGYSDNGDWVPVVDTVSGKVRISGEFYVQEDDETLDSFEHFLDWVCATILDPFQDELVEEKASAQAARQVSKAAAAEAMKLAKATKSNFKLEELSVFDDARFEVSSLQVDQHGKWAITVGRPIGKESARSLLLWNIARGSVERAFGPSNSENEPEIGYAAISPDGQRIAMTFWANSDLLLCASQSAATLKKIENVRGTPVFSPDGRLLGIGCQSESKDENTYGIFSGQDFEHVTRIALPPYEYVKSAQFTTGSRALVTVTTDNVIRTWGPITGNLIGSLPREKKRLEPMALSPDGRRVAVGMCDDQRCSVLLFDLESKEEVWDLPGETWVPVALSFSPDGALLATMDCVGVVRVLDAADGYELVRHFKPHAFTYTTPVGDDLQLMPDGVRLLTSRLNEPLRLMRLPEAVTSAQGRQALAEMRAPFQAKAIQFRGKLHQEFVFPEAIGFLKGLAVHPSGKWAATVGEIPNDRRFEADGDRTLHVWNIEERRLEGSFDHHKRPIIRYGGFRPAGHWIEREISIDMNLGAVAFSPDGESIAVSSTDDESVFVYEVHTGTLVKRIEGVKANATLLYSADGALLVVTGGPAWPTDEMVHVFDTRSFEPLSQWAAHRKPVRAAAIMPDSRRLITASQNRQIKIWDARTGKEIESVPEPRFPVSGIAISPDGAQLLLGSARDRKVKLIEAGTWQALRDLPGHHSEVTDLCFSPSGMLAATIDGDSVVRVWELSTGKMLAKHAKHERASWCGSINGTGIAFLPDRRHLVSCSWDGTMRLLRLPDWIVSA